MSSITVKLHKISHETFSDSILILGRLCLPAYIRKALSIFRVVHTESVKKKTLSFVSSLEIKYCYVSHKFYE